MVDLYTATLADAARAPGVPVPGDEGLEVLCRLRERIQVKNAGAFERTERVRRVRLFREDLARRAGELVVILRPSMTSELERAAALDGALAIWSMWRGYLEQPSESRMSERLARHGVSLEVHHVSGHAYVSDLTRLVDAIRPDVVVPIHTADPQRYASSLPGVVLRADGTAWSV